MKYMQYDEIRLTLQKVLSFPENLEKYLTAEQICDLIKLHYPSVWQEINNSFPNSKEYPMTITLYSASNFVAKALSYYSKNNGIPGLEPKETNDANINKTNPTDKTIFFWRLR